MLLFFFATQSVQAQNYNIGIRTGLNFSKFIGPAEEDIKQGSALNNGLHFGLTFNYHLTDKAGIRTELLYSQVGSKDSIIGQSYYVFPVNNERVIKEGFAKRTFDINNGYISIPIMGYYYPRKDLEIYGGITAAFLVNPTAGGILEFDDQDTTDLKYSFTQSLDYSYYSDRVGEGQNFGRPISVEVDGTSISLLQVAGAYYEFEEKKGSAYKVFDLGVTAGFSYYINRSFFFSLRGEYGLLDITNNKMDRSFAAVNEDGSFILRDDYDHNFNLQFSVGFRF
jgi:hypothetical protein